MNNKFISVGILLFGLIGLLLAESVQDIQVIDAATRNRLETIILSNAGGGVSTNVPTISTTNLTIYSGGTFRSLASSNYFTGPFYCLTNAPSSGYDFVFDKRWSSTAYLYGAFWGNSQGGYLDFGNSASSRFVELAFDGSSVITHNVQSGINTYGVVFGAVGQTFKVDGSGVSRKLTVTQTGVGIGPNGVVLTNVVSSAMVCDPPSLNTLTSFTTNIALTGARAGSSPVVVGSDYITNGITYFGYCLTNGEVMVEFRNWSAGTIDTASQTVRVLQTVVP